MLPQTRGSIFISYCFEKFKLLGLGFRILLGHPLSREAFSSKLI